MSVCLRQKLQNKCDKIFDPWFWALETRDSPRQNSDWQKFLDEILTMWPTSTNKPIRLWHEMMQHTGRCDISFVKLCLICKWHTKTEKVKMKRKISWCDFAAFSKRMHTAAGWYKMITYLFFHSLLFTSYIVLWFTMHASSDTDWEDFFFFIGVLHNITCKMLWYSCDMVPVLWSDGRCRKQVERKYLHSTSIFVSISKGGVHCIYSIGWRGILRYWGIVVWYFRWVRLGFQMVQIQRQ